MLLIYERKVKTLLKNPNIPGRFCFFKNEKVLELDVFCIILRCSVKYKKILHNAERDMKINSPKKIKFPYDNEVRKYYFYWEDTSLYRPHHHAKNI